MATTKTRINISIGKNIRDALRLLARREEVPVATKAAHLIEEALELEEDRNLSAIANKRLKGNVRYTKDRDAVWK